MGLKVVYERCAGGDIHKKTVTVHVVVPERSETRTYSTTTKELLALVEWLQALKVTHVAMESTGVYWKPLYNLLEATAITVFVVNAAHMKAVPGRKTDVQDAEWICDLMQHGLLKPSFIPPRPQRELRELRTRIELGAGDPVVLGALGTFLGRLLNTDLAERGRARSPDRTRRKRQLTASTSSRWAGAITHEANRLYAALSGLLSQRNWAQLHVKATSRTPRKPKKVAGWGTPGDSTKQPRANL